ncbi:MAG TPA: hypothetical protein VHW96_06140 [Solirubrobacteraceae bacterium]|nr:hypothetical protein [Solirubrobacteraceae bacterium]
MALVAAAVGIYIATKTSNEGIKAYTLQETLPKMVSDFGPKARVVQVSTSGQNVDFQVIPGDGQLHIRNYDIVSSEISAGTTGYNRKVTNVVRAPTAAETAQARVTLGQIDSGVVDRLLDKAGFSRGDTSVILSGGSWVLETYKGPSDGHVASFDGSGLHRAQLSGPAGTVAQSAPAATSSATSTATTTRTVSSTATFSTTFKVTRNPKAGKLLHCIVNAQGDVTKILKCQERFPP